MNLAVMTSRSPDERRSQSPFQLKRLHRDDGIRHRDGVSEDALWSPHVPEIPRFCFRSFRLRRPLPYKGRA